MLEAVLLNMKFHGRIAVRGMISLYNREKRDGVHNLLTVAARRIRMQGFISDIPLYHKFIEDMSPILKQGMIAYVEETVEGLENAPKAHIGLFSGKKFGKQAVVARE